MKIIYAPRNLKAIWFHEPAHSYVPPAVMLFKEGDCHNIAELILGRLDEENSERFYNFPGGYIRTQNGEVYAVKDRRTVIDMRFSDDKEFAVKLLTDFLRGLFKEK